MTLIRTVEPAVEPVTLAEVKAHLRLDSDSDDALLNGLIHAAREDVERMAGIALVEQRWRLVLDDWPRAGRVAIPLHPVREILAITLYGPEGEASLLGASGYQTDADSRPARVQFLTGPETLRAMNGIEIDFSAGFGEAATDVPELLRRAVVLLVAHWYEFRAGFGPGDQPVSYPTGYDRMIAPYRRGRL